MLSRYTVKHQETKQVLGYSGSASAITLLARKMSQITGSRVGIYDRGSPIEGEEYERGIKIKPITPSLQVKPESKENKAATPMQKPKIIIKRKTIS